MRKAFPSPFLLAAALLVAPLFAGAQAHAETAAPTAAPASAKPNIVYILADDLGWKDVGYHGSDIRTPNIDSLAAGGVRLNEFYAQPLCTPTRAALMTGRYPFRYGLQTLVIPSGYTYGLPTDEWLLPQALHDAGYYTAIVGKWHLGHADRKFWPTQRGFEYQYGPMIGELDYFTHEQHGVTDWFREGKLLKEKGYATQLLGNDAEKLIRAHDPKKPLFLYLAFTSPHTPYQAPQEYLDRYPNIADKNRRAYAGMITCMDDQIGRVLKALDDKGMRDNTIVVFQSDNGGTTDSKFTGEGDVKGPLPPDNGPYREGKGSVYEGGTHVPALISWPGHLKHGSYDGILHVVDMYPTLAALAGASTAKTKPLDGFDFWPALTQGKPDPRSEVVYNLEPYRAALREGDWKLVWYPTLPSRTELFDLKTDPGEKNDLAARKPEKAAEMKKRIEELATAAAPPMLLQAEFKNAMGRLKLPPALPDENSQDSPAAPVAAPAAH